MLALSIRQPYAELILRGVKTIEYRTVRTTKIGERFYIYVSQQWAGVNGFDGPAFEALRDDELPTGVIVGSAVISKCIKGDTYYEWHLKDVKRYTRHRKPTRQPQPVWFRPFSKAA